jgi:hypothetical protein
MQTLTRPTKFLLVVMILGALLASGPIQAFGQDGAPYVPISVATRLTPPKLALATPVPQTKVVRRPTDILHQLPPHHVAAKCGQPCMGGCADFQCKCQNGICVSW